MAFCTTPEGWGEQSLGRLLHYRFKNRQISAELAPRTILREQQASQPYARGSIFSVSIYEAFKGSNDALRNPLIAFVSPGTVLDHLLQMRGQILRRLKFHFSRSFLYSTSRVSLVATSTTRPSELKHLAVSKFDHQVLVALGNLVDMTIDCGASWISTVLLSKDRSQAEASFMNGSIIQFSDENTDSRPF